MVHFKARREGNPGGKVVNLSLYIVFVFRGRWARQLYYVLFKNACKLEYKKIL